MASVNFGEQNSLDVLLLVVSTHVEVAGWMIGVRWVLEIAVV
jgi:hypothetical protein